MDSFVHKIVVMCLTCLILWGCSGIGPGILPYNALAFNESVLQSTEEQMLLNLVRLQYGDRPYFLTISNLTASNSMALGADYSYGYTKSQSKYPSVTSWGVSHSLATPNFTYSDSPTIIYSPMETQNFATAMLSAISMKEVFLLIDTDWSLSRVFRTVFKRIGPLENAINASRPSSSTIPIYQEFANFAHYATKLQHKGMLSVALTTQGDDAYINILIHKKYRHTAAVRQFFHMLGIKKVYSEIILKRGFSFKPNNNVVTVETRSLLGTLYYLSKGVEVAPREVISGVVVFPRYPNGLYFPWNRVTRGMIFVRMSPTRRPDASVQVYYRNRWYYILNTDSDSKEALTFLQQLFLLMVGDTLPAAPLISYNVNTG